MKIAVTLASGKLGTAILRELKASIGADNTIAIARNPSKVRISQIETRKGDYNSKIQFEHALKGIDVLILISGMDTPDERVRQHRNIIKAAKENGLKKIVFVSIYGAEQGNNFSPIVQSSRQTVAAALA